VTHVTKRSIVLVILLLLSVARGAIADDQELKLEIGLSKSTFLVAEPIWLDVTLANVSTDTVRITWMSPSHRNGWFDIELKDGQGNVMPYEGRVALMASSSGPDGWVLHAQEKYYECFDLLEFFRSSRMKGLVYVMFLRFLDPGKYEVRARYGGIHSNKVSFEVVEPTGDEKQAHQLLHKAFSLLSEKKSDLQRQKLQELIDRFPASVYVEKAHRELFQPDELLRKFPNSGYCEFILRHLTGKLARDDKREFLEKVIQDYPGTRSARYAQQMLKWLEE
jgi:hypothetical protein